MANYTWNQLSLYIYFIFVCTLSLYIQDEREIIKPWRKRIDQEEECREWGRRLSLILLRRSLALRSCFFAAPLDEPWTSSSCNTITTSFPLLSDWARKVSSFSRNSSTIVSAGIWKRSSSKLDSKIWWSDIRNNGKIVHKYENNKRGFVLFFYYKRSS